MNIVHFFGLSIIILSLLTCLFFIEKYFEKKLKESDALKWRSIFGAVQFVIALLASIWIRENSYILKREFFFLITAGIAILAIVGIADMSIVILNSLSGKKIVGRKD